MAYYIIISIASLGWLGYTFYDMFKNIKRMNGTVQLQTVQNKKKN